MLASCINTPHWLKHSCWFLHRQGWLMGSSDGEMEAEQLNPSKQEEESTTQI